MNTTDGKLRWLFSEPEGDDLSGHAHRQLIGYVGLLLPVTLWVMAGLRPTRGLEAPWALLGSISAYYYTSAVSAFSGSLVALALFLWAYRGYNNQYGHRDRVAAIVAGSAAFLVAFFPAEAPIGMPNPSWWTGLIGGIHYVSAVVLFACFAFFSLFQFPSSKSGRVNPFQYPGSRSQQGDVGKWARNWVYYSCGVAIVACLVWAFGTSLAKTSIFWPETLALEFFALSWLVKGRTDKTVGRVWHAIRGEHKGPH